MVDFHGDGPDSVECRATSGISRNSLRTSRPLARLALLGEPAMHRFDRGRHHKGQSRLDDTEVQMNDYGVRGVMLDSGLTALALRGLTQKEGHYPFIERFTKKRRVPRPTGRRPTPSVLSRSLVPFLAFLSRWQPASRWLRADRSTPGPAGAAPQGGTPRAPGGA